MKKKIVGILVMTLLIATAINAIGTTNEIKNKENLLTSGPEIEWMKTYGGAQFDQFRCVQQTSDSGYIAYGEYEESDMTYARLMKLNANGDEVWSVVNYNINGTGYDVEELMNYVIQTSDGGYLASGYQSYYYSEAEFWYICGFLWKVDSNGITEWLKYYYDLDEIIWICIAQIIEADDGYIGGGFLVDIVEWGQPDYDLDFSIIKVDFDGNLVWYEQYDLGGYEFASSINITSDSGYFLSGTYSVNNIIGDDDDDYIMMKTYSNRTKEWQKIYGGENREYSPTRGCGQTPDGGYTMCGFTTSFEAEGGGLWDIWQIKTDSKGDIEWENLFGGTGNENCWSMQITSDGGIIMAIDYNQGLDDLLLVKTDEMGNIVVNVLFEEVGRQIPIFINETDDGGFIICGRTGDPDNIGTDSLLIKISAIENQRPDKPDIPSGPTEGKINTEYTFTTSATDPDGDNITYGWDWDDGSDIEWFDTGEASHSWAEKDKYLVRVMAKDEHGGESDWSDPLEVMIPRDKATNNMMLMRLQERFPLLQKLLVRFGL